jgi:hypothetical protein
MKQKQVAAEKEAELVHLGRDVRANLGFSNAKVYLMNVRNTWKE